MKKCKITVMRIACYKDLMEQYENPISNACDMVEGQVWIDGLQMVGRSQRECVKALGRVCRLLL